jgi:hypothetical protein
LLTATAGPGGQASLGLTPDWAGDGYGTYSTDLADANVFDPALRLSPGYPMPGADADCQNFVCRPGETQWVLAQWMNQGTHTLRRFRAVITAPQGSVITQVRPYTGYGPGTGNAARGFRVVDVATKTALRLIIPDWFLTSPSAKVRIGVRPQVLPGTEFLLAIGYRMNDDAPFSDGNNDGVPDCSADTGQANPGQTCERATDFAPGSYIAWGAVVSIRNAVDADATFCPQIPNNCPALGVHDKTKPGDSNDAGAWKVDSSFPPG